jgi:tetratricopeptide (TPR) repeat protein
VKHEESDKAARAGEEWFSRGYQLHQSNRYPEAIEAFKHSIELAYREATAMYNIACIYALAGDRDSGIEWLEKSVKAGFDNDERIQHDPDILSLRVDPRFNRIAEASRALSLSQFFKKSNGSLYSMAQWAPAVQMYQSLVEREPNNGRAWFNLGYALHYSRQHTRAIEAFEYARQLGYRRSISTYNIACAYSMLEQRELAFEWLERAVDDGYDASGYINGDRDLDNLRSDPRFQRLVRNYGNSR